MTQTTDWWGIVKGTTRRFGEIDGEQRAAAFSYYAFLSLFPLLALFVTLGSHFVDRTKATSEVIDFINQYLPLPPSKQNLIFDTVRDVLKARGRAGIIATLFLLWSSMKFLKVVIRSTNRAWKLDTYNWWRLPLKRISLMGVVASAFLVGIIAPVVAGLLRNWLTQRIGGVSWAFDLALFLVPLLVLFFSLCLIYIMAPNRRTTFNEVWLPALGATLLFRVGEMLFFIYVKSFSHFNVLYGALGGIIAFLIWIYFIGIIFVAGACCCAVRIEMQNQPAQPS